MDIISGILLAFFTQWSHPDHPPVKVNHSELNDAETTLGIRFPEDYKAEVLSVGLPSPTLALLEAIDEREADLHDLSGLYAPHDIIEVSTGWWKIGMPKNLIAIGNDSMGNKFCFDIADLRGDTVASAPVYFWDHDFGTVELVGASFLVWIGNYVEKWSAGLTYKDF